MSRTMLCQFVRCDWKFEREITLDSEFGFWSIPRTIQKKDRNLTVYDSSNGHKELKWLRKSPSIPRCRGGELCGHRKTLSNMACSSCWRAVTISLRKLCVIHACNSLPFFVLVALPNRIVLRVSRSPASHDRVISWNTLQSDLPAAIHFKRKRSGGQPACLYRSAVGSTHNRCHRPVRRL